MHLFHLKPRGMGTQDVESLDSYIYRYAAIHGVTTNKFIERCVELAGGAVGRTDNHRALHTGGIPLVSLIRPNKTTQFMLEVLELLTGNTTLENCTLISLKGVLDRDTDTYSKNLRWCPACVAEFETSNDEGYFKLLWQIKPVKHCPIHHIELRNTCYSCGRHQNSGDLRVNSTSCIRCGTSLSEGITLEGREPSWAPDAPDLVNLIEEISHNQGSRFKPHSVQDVLSWLFDLAWEHGHEDVLWKMVPRDLCLSIISGHKAVSLDTARQIAIMLNLRLVDLLQGIDGVAHESFNLPFLQSTKPALSVRKRRNKRDRTAIYRRLNVLLNEERDTPYSLKAICEKLGVSTGYVRYHFPVQTEVIAERYQSWRAAERERKRQDAASEIVKILVSNRGVNVSKKRVVAQIMSKSDLPKNILRQEFDRIFTIYSSNTN